MSSTPRSRGIVAGGRRFFLLSACLAALLLGTGVVGWYLAVTVDAPRLEHGVLFARSVTDSNKAMLDQETGLRGYQLTGDPSFLAPFRDGQSRYLRQSALSWHLVATPRLEKVLLETDRRASAWSTEYAVPQIARTAPGRPSTDAALALAHGRVLFDAYRAGYEELLKETRAANTVSLHHGQHVAALVNGAQVLLGAAALLMAGRRRRRLQDDLVRPVEEVAAVVRRLAAGDTTARPERYADVEVDELGSAVRRPRPGHAGVPRRGADTGDGRGRPGPGLPAGARRSRTGSSGHLERAGLVRALLREVVHTARVEAAVVHDVTDGRVGDELGSRVPDGERLLADDVGRGRRPPAPPRAERGRAVGRRCRSATAGPSTPCCT